MDEIKENLGEKVCKELSVNGKKVSLELEVFGIEEYDSKGNMIHSKDSYGDEYWYEYDSKGNKIHSKDSDGDEWWYEYDSKGNVIHYKDSSGSEIWREYDSKGKEIHRKTSEGSEWWYEYTFWDNGKVKTKTEYKTL